MTTTTATTPVCQVHETRCAKPRRRQTRHVCHDASTPALCCCHGRLSSATRNCKTPPPSCGPKQPPPPSPPYPSSLAHRRTWDCRPPDLSRSRSEPTNQKQKNLVVTLRRTAAAVPRHHFPARNKLQRTGYMHACRSPILHLLPHTPLHRSAAAAVAAPLVPFPRTPIRSTPLHHHVFVAVRSSLCLLRSTKSLLPPSNFPTRQRAAARLTPRSTSPHVRSFVAHHQKTPLAVRWVPMTCISH
ncbi:uncharacterized protein J3D65DRAFT_466843 [Phyllosticta citribraziliensis]|uniref:Uncharacterized protein n=1 Tax=Phyllosticta citribraziliensis TaxID=989973 RepID=A0ABR1LJR6_9PEZI